MATNKLKQITAAAKKLYKTGKYKKWTDAIKAASKQIGAVKIIEKGESKNAKVKKVLQQQRTKKGQFKGLKKVAGTRHKDTKSHNVNIRVVSGIGKVIAGMQKKYLAIYQTNKSIVADEIFSASSLSEAKKYAAAYKRREPSLAKVKNVRTSVKLYKN